ncbi:dynein light chain 4, axonemal isoform X1 [Choloepus didactylus]|uniref:dynein light chain 4, axonemal isoform X1 n=1 Tax=Choloepus didactylus TaxID=27675 RepID=UPI0018A01DBB|nr:dynein light chain 4, axonemal isoform X1 [Choloepus didactylus]XP_037703930.1 dynein light chain 4, axonemal isoform X1 [Choloepus didactylus]XP_037703931.1 dynein light chain 4, axonemal isoform X1 [Choloepus didactylus]
MGETEGKKDEADYKRLQTFPLVRHSDMPEEMRVETMELCVTACEKFSNNNESAAKMIKETMDKKFGSSWHVVIGEGFGFEITHEVPLTVLHPQHSCEVSAVLVFSGHMKMAPRRSLSSQGTLAASLLVLWGSRDPPPASPSTWPQAAQTIASHWTSSSPVPGFGMRGQAALPPLSAPPSSGTRPLGL